MPTLLYVVSLSWFHIPMFFLNLFHIFLKLCYKFILFFYMLCIKFISLT